MRDAMLIAWKALLMVALVVFGLALGTFLAVAFYYALLLADALLLFLAIFAQGSALTY